MRITLCIAEVGEVLSCLCPNKPDVGKERPGPAPCNDSSSNLFSGRIGAGSYRDSDVHL